MFFETPGMNDARRHEFQAEVKQLLDLMVHSLYSNKDIFLRELVSNASDALDRLRFAAVTEPSLLADRALEIRLDSDRENRTLTIWDNGIGMSREEVVENIGTIAKSGTKAFLHELGQADAKDRPELIGQFGVGFYSSFMVAERVELVTRRAGQDTATTWSSTGDGYEIGEGERPQSGTTLTLHLKPVDEENHLSDYTDEFVLRNIVKRYSDFVAYPIKMKVWENAKEGTGKVLEERVLNSQKAIWARPKDDVTEEEYREFYRHISHDWHEPLEKIVVKIEGTFEAQAILFIPSTAPFDLFHPEMKRGIQLYVKRVFIMDECKELIPPYLRFVKGVVDAQDLSLNVSREILQKDRQIRAIRKNLVRKVLDTLKTMKTEEPKKYDGFFAQFGPALKEGIVGGESHEVDAILDVLLAPSTRNPSTPTSLADYVSRMKEDQDRIYYLTGPSLDAIKNSPHLEALVERGFEVLLFTDPIDEIWLERGLKYQEKTFASVGRGEVDLGKTAEEKARAEKDREERQADLKDMLGALRVHLQDHVKEVRLSDRLTSSAACLVGDPGDPTPQMEKLMRQLGQEPTAVKRVLELNPSHGLLERLKGLHAEAPGGETFQDYAELLYGQALLAEGGQIEDPARFARLVADLMTRA